MGAAMFDVTGDYPGSVFLLTGEKNILFDAGMGYCARIMTEKVGKYLGDRRLDAVFLSHSHYDHISGVPYLRERWPDLTVYGSAYAKRVLEKPSALDTIRSLNANAAREAGVPWTDDYQDKDLKIDCPVKADQTLNLGGHRVTVYDSPGHTRDSLSFFIDEETLMCSETVGVINHKGIYMPNFLVGYRESLNSIHTLRSLGAKEIIFPHYGRIDREQYPDIWEFCLNKMEESRDLMIKMLCKNLNEDTLIEQLKPFFWDEEMKQYQPYEAYALNMKSMLKTIREEFPAELAECASGLQ